MLCIIMHKHVSYKLFVQRNQAYNVSFLGQVKRFQGIAYRYTYI
jgi:hypothetical protein